MPWKAFQEIEQNIKYLFASTPQAVITDMDYNDYWQVRKPRPIPARAIVLSQLIGANSSILDIGCGDGEIFGYLKEHNNVNAVGMDISEVAVEKACQRGMNAVVQDVTVPNFSVASQYDYVLVSEVIEHIINPEYLLDKLHGTFRKGLLITVPNIGFYLHRIRLMFGRFPIQWQWHPSEHLRFWTVKDFSEMVTNHGYIIKDIRSSNGFPFVDQYYPNWHNWWPNLLGEVVVFQLEDLI